MKSLQTLQQKSFYLLEEIITDVYEGKLLHVQDTFHKETSCGTAHCIAGWFMVLIANEAGIKLKYTHHQDYGDGCFSTAVNTDEVIEAFLSRELDNDQELKDTCYEEIKHFIDCDLSEEWALATAVLGLEFYDSLKLFGATLGIKSIRMNFEKIKEDYLG